jgi:hypothetical protein
VNKLIANKKIGFTHARDRKKSLYSQKLLLNNGRDCAALYAEKIQFPRALHLPEGVGLQHLLTC